VIVVDSSVWLDFLNGRSAPHVRRLRAILGIDEVIVGDLMLCEVLQGLESKQPLRNRIDGRGYDCRRECSQFPFFTSARDHCPQDNRPLDRDLVH